MENKILETLELILIKLDKIQTRLDILDNRQTIPVNTKNAPNSDIKSRISEMRNKLMDEALEKVKKHSQDIDNDIMREKLNTSPIIKLK